MTELYTFILWVTAFVVSLIALLIIDRKPVIKFRLASKYVTLPTKRDEDAGYDIYPHFKDLSLVIPPHKTALIPTGLYSVIPKGYYMQLKERSSTGSKTVIQQAGVIDSGYRGEWKVPITNGGTKPLIIAKFPEDFDSTMTTILPYNKAICQATLERVHPSKIKRISSVAFAKCCNTERGEGGFGSSGK